jgi:transposase InsO family protein
VELGSRNSKNTLGIRNYLSYSNECLASTAEILRPKKRSKVEDLSTVTLGYILSKSPSNHGEKQRIRVLFDSGCSATLINRAVLKNWKKTKGKTIKWSTKAGSFKTKRLCDIEFTLPAFYENRKISCTAYVDETPQGNVSYDMIIGRDVMHNLGINLLFDTAQISWDGATIYMQSPERLKKDWVAELENEILFAHDPDTTDAERIQQIIDAKYCPADLEKVVEECTHLTVEERKKLLKLLQKFEHLFDGTIGTWQTEPVDLELKDPNAKPHHAKPYPVPHSQERKLREEIDRFVQYGILRKINRSEWACPMFTISKPDGSLRSLADLRELNKVIKRKPYPLPKITDMLQKLEGFMYATSLDLNMGYYHILLTPNASRLCTIVVPWGKYEYLRLPMGLCNSPDIFQEKMSELMQGLEFARAYLDDLLVISNEPEFDKHLEKLEIVLDRLSEGGLKINAVKSFFGRTSLEYLGYNISREGIRPSQSKVQAILQIERPKTRKQLRRFIGMVNYYRDMWPQRSHFLAPLSTLTSVKVKWKWTDEHQVAFDQMKALIAKETLLTFPDFSKEFEIHTDASKLQLGACISQEGKPVAFYSRKLQPAQTRYTTTERELLSIVETLKEFRNILLGQKIKIHTDHENLTYKQFNSDRVMRWRLYLEEYSPDLHYIKGTHNVVADALSRLDISETPHEDTPETFLGLMDCFVKEPAMDYHPLNYQHLHHAQVADKTLMKNLKKDETPLVEQDFHGGGKTTSLICYKGKIVIPALLQKHVTAWYHTTLCHPGINRTEESIGQHLWWPKMREHITNYVKICPLCQRNKRKQKLYGFLPPKLAEAIPWDVLCIDLIGPYKIRRKGKKFLVCRCVTMIDPATGWFEIHEYDDKRAITVANIVEQEWFARYPWPTQIIFDRGNEFMGQDFKDMIKNDYGIKGKPITTRNPQANAIVERVHQVIANIIRTFELENNYMDEEDPWKGILSATAFAVRSTYHTTLQSTPGQLVFGRDMILNIKHEANWEFIRARKQKIIHRNNKAENDKRIPHTYSVGDKVLLKRGTENKYEAPYTGPHTILQVNDNGTVRMKVKNVEDTYNIRRLTPFYDAEAIAHGGECSMRTSKAKRKRQTEE